MKFALHVLFAGFFLFSLLGAAQVQAVSVGGTCTSNSDCADADGPYSCKSISDNPNTTTIEGGVCGGACTTDAQCDGVKNSLGWEGVKCTGTQAVTGPPAKPAVNGVCLELPRATSRLPLDVPEKGAELLATIDTITNWVFAIFVILAIIFVLLAAFQFVTGGGDEAKISEARQKLIWAAVGIIIALLSKGLVPVIRAIVGG